MSQGLPSLDLNMDASAPKKDDALDQLSKGFPLPSDLEAKEKAAGKLSTQEISASLLDLGQSTGLDSTKRQQVEKEGTRGTSIPNSSAFWENGQTNGGKSLLTGPKLLGAKSAVSASFAGDFLSNSKKRVFVMMGGLFLLIVALLVMNPTFFSSVPGLSQLGLLSSDPASEVETLTATEAIPAAGGAGMAKDRKADGSGVGADQKAGLGTGADSNLEVALTWQENPYWYLPNELSQKVTLPPGKWNPEQEEAWGSAADASLMWPKYQSLFEIRKTPLEGAEQVLWRLSTGKKFWLRIMALMGLAEMGQKVDTAHVEQALEGVHPELIGRFVSRFEKTSTVGERVILRHLVKLVNEDTRLSILRALISQKDRFTFLYLAAGSYDPGVSVAKFSKRHLQKVQPEELERLKSVVRGEVVFDQAPTEATPTPSAESPEVVGGVPAAAAPSQSGLSPVAAQPDGGTSVGEESLEEIGEKIVNSPDSSKPIQIEETEVNSEEALLIEE
jgi:hypothetical protein